MGTTRSKKPPSVTEIDSLSAVRSADVAVLKLWADWCQPCKGYARTFEEVADEAKDTKSAAQFFSMDIEGAGHDELLKTLLGKRVSTIPLTVVLLRGRVVKSEIGALSRRELQGLIRGAVAV